MSLLSELSSLVCVGRKLFVPFLCQKTQMGDLRKWRTNTLYLSLKANPSYYIAPTTEEAFCTCTSLPQK